MPLKKLFFAPILLFGALFLLLPASSLASTEADWTLQGSENIYDPELKTLVPEEVAEASVFNCTDENGNSLDLNEQEILSQISLASADIFDGTFSFGQGALLSAGEDESAVPANGGYPSGASGMQKFLSTEARLLATGRWTPYDGRALLRTTAEAGEDIKSYSNPSAGWRTALGSAEPLERGSGQKVALFLPLSAQHPLEISGSLPEACALQAPEPDQPSLQTQLERPGDYLIDQILYVPGKLAYSSQEFLQPHAFRYTFWTPHTERGDLMWEVPTSCVPEGDKYFSRTERNEACQNLEPLGYSDNFTEIQENNSWFLAAAQTLQWLVSGTYFLILFASVLIYMFRGSRMSTISILRLIPRILLAMLVTLMAGFFLGSLISLSNNVVELIFDFNSAPAVGSLNAFLLQSGNIVGGPDIIQRLVSLLVGIATVFFFAVFLLASLLRQILLVAVVILAPLAALTLIVPSWKKYFSFYWRTAAACLLMPVLLALVLKIGMSINPLLLRPEAAYGEIQGFLGLMLVLVTLWFMYRLIRLSFSFALRGSSALELDEMRALLQSGRENAATLERPKKNELAPAPGPALTALAGAGVAQSLPRDQHLAGRADSNSKAQVPENPWSSFQNKQKARRRLSNVAARRYKQGLLHFLQKMRKGEKPLSPEEQRKAIQAYAKHKGGYLEKHKGSWHLRK